MSQNVDLHELHSFAVEIARVGGDKIIAASKKRAASAGQALTNEKKNSVDLVTETDQAVENYLMSSISQKYPDHVFIGEETYASGKETHLGSGPTWAVDPVDGTTNFVHSFPFVAVSIGFFLDGKPAVGVVYNPFLDQLYTAIRGQGAYLNSSEKLPAVQPSPLTEVRGSLLGNEWGSDRSTAPGSNFVTKCETFSNLMSEQGAMAHGLRSLGSVALTMCMVAAGQLDAMWEGGCWIWDVGAASCIVQEAGGLMTHANSDRGESLHGTDYESRAYLAVRASPGGHEEQKRFVKDLHKYTKGKLQY